MCAKMPDGRITAVEVQFARQLYHSCRERYGEENPQTRLVWSYLSSLDHRGAHGSFDPPRGSGSESDAMIGVGAKR